MPAWGQMHGVTEYQFRNHNNEFIVSLVKSYYIRLCSALIFIRCNCWRSVSISMLLLFRRSLRDTWLLSATFWSSGRSSSSSATSTACNFVLSNLFSFSKSSILFKHFLNSDELATWDGKSEKVYVNNLTTSLEEYSTRENTISLNLSRGE